MSTHVDVTVDQWRSARRREIEEALLESLDGATTAALVGFPRYRNAGDAAIWLGAKELLAGLGVDVGYQADDMTFDVDALTRAVGADAPLLITGGGNLGTLWPRQHGFREHVIRSCTSRRIVQLSQSAYFADLAAVDDFGRLLADHGDVWIHLRDTASESLIRERVPAAQTRLVPDLAVAAPIEATDRIGDGSLLWIGRTDREAVDRAVPGASTIIDWATPDGADRVEKAALWTMRRSDAIAHGSYPVADWLARRRVAAACLAIERAGAVVTSRLHGHIFCVLLGRAHAVISDRHGKIPNFASTWESEQLSLVEFIDADADPGSVARAIAAKHHIGDAP